jgi:hypothetical protein
MFDLLLWILIGVVLVVLQVLQNDINLLNPPAELEKLKHKKKSIVQSPNSFFMVLSHTIFMKKALHLACSVYIGMCLRMQIMCDIAAAVLRLG